jgi:hypothetical protein
VHCVLSFPAPVTCIYYIIIISDKINNPQQGSIGAATKTVLVVWSSPVLVPIKLILPFTSFPLDSRSLRGRFNLQLPWPARIGLTSPTAIPFFHFSFIYPVFIGIYVS